MRKSESDELPLSEISADELKRPHRTGRRYASKPRGTRGYVVQEQTADPWVVFGSSRTTAYGRALGGGRD